ncbi:hypothetical protein MMC30_005637 [Trapelia coarctata]|nr:hypothetical protein [Trapelia coarctata]
MCNKYYTNCLACNQLIATSLSPCPSPNHPSVSMSVHLSEAEDEALEPGYHYIFVHETSIPECAKCEKMQLERDIKAIRKRQGEVDPRIDKREIDSKFWRLGRVRREKEARKVNGGVVGLKGWKDGEKEGGEGEEGGVEEKGVGKGDVDGEEGGEDMAARRMGVAKAGKGRLWKGFRE